MTLSLHSVVELQPLLRCSALRNDLQRLLIKDFHTNSTTLISTPCGKAHYITHQP